MRNCLPLFVLLMTLAAATAQAQVPASNAVRPALDLHAPPLNHVLSAREIEALTTYVEDTEPESILVRARREPAACCGAFIAVPWAFLNPNQAWRIFTPYEGACPGTWCTEPLPPTQAMTPLARPTPLP